MFLVTPVGQPPCPPPPPLSQANFCPCVPTFSGDGAKPTELWCKVIIHPGGVTSPWGDSSPYHPHIRVVLCLSAQVGRRRRGANLCPSSPRTLLWEVYNLFNNKSGKTSNSSNLNGVYLKPLSLEYFASFPIDVILHRKSGQ